MDFHHPEFNTLIHRFEAHQNPEYALKMKAYLKNHFEFYGINAPLRKELMKNWKKECAIPFSEELLEDLWKLFISPKRELSYVAIELLIPILKKNANENHVEYITKLITTHSWWDTVDAIASSILGSFLMKSPEKRVEIIEEYTASNHIWLQRSTLIFQLKYGLKTDQDLLFAQCIAFMEEKEFFLQKAIGWSLRQYAKTHPAEVYDFVDRNQFSNLAKREANKYRGK